MLYPSGLFGAMWSSRGYSVDKTDNPVGIKLKRHLPSFSVLAKWLGLRFSKRSFLRKWGFFESVRYRAPCRPDGSPLPWMNYAMIIFLEERLKPEMSVFEYGSGSSTLFFAGRVNHVTSVEKDAGWHGHVKDTMPENVKLILCEPYSTEAYLKVIGEQGQKFDIVIVDAEERRACLKDSINWLTPGGVVLLDDASEEAYSGAMNEIVELGFKRLVFEGMKPGGFNSYRTAIFYKSDNVFGL
jgi:hypothetical protein